MRGPCRLSNKIIGALSGPVMLWDDDPATTGFGIRVYPSGVKSFFLDYRLRGVHRRYTIGKFPRWSAEAARDQAKKLRKQIDQGIDIAQDKRERRDAPTVQDLIDRYVTDHLPKRRLTEHRLRDEKRMLDMIADKLGRHTKVTDIHGGDIGDMHRRLSESNGPVRANRILAVCSKMFSLSLVPLAGENLPWRDAASGNPCKGIEKNHEEGRERFFSQAELTAIGDALDKYQNPVAADCVRLMMLTGCRPSEAAKATWGEFDAEPGYWVKPSAHTKQKKTHRLPLSPPALELIDRLRKKHNSKWVFPSDRTNDHLVTPSLWHIWQFVRKQADLGRDARLYDLRHSFASVGAGGGLSLHIIGKLLGHSQARTTQRYAHLGDDPLREAATKITTVITGQKSGDITPLRGRRS